MILFLLFYARIYDENKKIIILMIEIDNLSFNVKLHYQIQIKSYLVF